MSEAVSYSYLYERLRVSESETYAECWARLRAESPDIRTGVKLLADADRNHKSIDFMPTYALQLGYSWYQIPDSVLLLYYDEMVTRNLFIRRRTLTDIYLITRASRLPKEHTNEQLRDFIQDNQKDVMLFYHNSTWFAEYDRTLHSISGIGFSNDSLLTQFMLLKDW